MITKKTQQQNTQPPHAEHELAPYSGPWFRALESINPRQAAHARAILRLHGPRACCYCGDGPETGDTGTQEYRVLNADQPPSTRRLVLCPDCRQTAQELFDLETTPV